MWNLQARVEAYGMYSWASIGAISNIFLLEDFFCKECDVELLGICKGEPSVQGVEFSPHIPCNRANYIVGYGHALSSSVSEV